MTAIEEHYCEACGRLTAMFCYHCKRIFCFACLRVHHRGLPGSA